MPDDDIDQLINAAITRVGELLGPIVDQAVARHTAGFHRHHKKLADDTTQLTRSVAAGVARLDAIEHRQAGIDRRVADLDARTMAMEAVTYSAYQTGLARRLAQAMPPVPPELAAACAQPAGHRAKLVLNVFGRRMNAVVSGGRDADEVWRDMHESVCDYAEEVRGAAVPPTRRPPRGPAGSGDPALG